MGVRATPTSDALRLRTRRQKVRALAGSSRAKAIAPRSASARPSQPGHLRSFSLVLAASASRSFLEYACVSSKSVSAWFGSATQACSQTSNPLLLPLRVKAMPRRHRSSADIAPGPILSNTAMAEESRPNRTDALANNRKAGVSFALTFNRARASSTAFSQSFAEYAAHPRLTGSETNSPLASQVPHANSAPATTIIRRRRPRNWQRSIVFSRSACALLCAT
jgi:hypothetical protein